MVKIVAFFVLCISFYSKAMEIPEDLAQDLMKKVSTCMEETNAQFEVVINMKNGVFADDPKLKKYLVCLFKKTKAMTENGDFQSDYIKKEVQLLAKDPKKAEKILNECLVKKATPEESAIEAAKCVYNALPEEDKKKISES